LWNLYKFGKKSLFSQRELGFPSILWIDFPPLDKLLAPKLTKSVAMETFWRALFLAIGL
jgi:hypothetical protein